MEIQYLNALCGAGKTYALAQYAHRIASRGRKVLFVQPTKELITKTIESEFGPLDPDYTITPIHGDSVDECVVRNIVAHFKKPSVGGEIVFITHAAFEQVPHFRNKEKWCVVIDEVPQVEVFWERNLPEAHTLITPYIDMQPSDGEYGLLVAKESEPRLGKIARNSYDDDILRKEFSALANRIVSRDWDVYTLWDQFHNLINGDKKSLKFQTYSILSPSRYEGFRQVIIAGAQFQETLLYRLWKERVSFVSVGDGLRESLRYKSHPNGNLLSIFYACEDDWSKRLRDRIVESTALIDLIEEKVISLFQAETFLYMANNDVSDLFSDCQNAIRLPNTPHGLNQYSHLHDVVVLSALNPTSALFGYMKSRGINGDEVRSAIYRQAVYQAIARCSLRDPNNPSRKRVVVMDRSTAEWLAALFPGSSLEPLPGMPAIQLKGRGGRPRCHVNHAAKTKACRENEKQRLLEELNKINSNSFFDGFYPEIDPKKRNETSIYNGGFVTQKAQTATLYSSIYDAKPITYLDQEETAFISLLRGLHCGVVAKKEDNGLIAPAHFDPDRSDDTCRGLANIEYIRGIWLDNDGGDLFECEFVKLFPNLRIITFNTFSHSQASRWRVFIPTSCAMSVDVHSLIMKSVEKTLNKNGYWSKSELQTNHRIKDGKHHGFDTSKFNASSLFYLPCQAKNPADSFFHDHDGPGRGVLDVRLWVEQNTIDLLPEPIADIDTIVSPAAPTSSGTRLRQMQARLEGLDEEAFENRQRVWIETALADWRGTPKGQGNAAFFKLAHALRRARLDEEMIRRHLIAEARQSNSPRERQREIKGLMKSVKILGLL